MPRMLAVSIAALIVTGCQGMQVESAAREDSFTAARPADRSTAAPATGDAARGALRSSELYCDACHGVNGSSETAEWPSIAGQNAAYLAGQLKLLRSGDRPSPEMQPIAAALTDADIADLSAHYSGQVLVTRPASSDGAATGESLYREGDPARAIPACSSCHDADGRGNPTMGAPVVRGQQPGYSSRQLEAYARRTRYASASGTAQEKGNLEVMYASAEKLTPEEIRSLAAYLQGMP
jgi:cytochrome c553